MRCFVIFMLVLSSAWSYASNYSRHMVQVTTQGLGIGAGYEKTDPRSDSQFKDFDTFKGNIELNYAFTFTSRFQAGFLFSNRSEERDYDTKTNGQGELSINTLIAGVFGQWNFDDNLMEAWYAGLMFSYLNHEEESSNKVVFNKLEDDKNAETYEIFLGKRYSMNKWGLSSITFSPSLSFYIQRARKDFEDDGLQDNMGVNFQLIKFDVIF